MEERRWTWFEKYVYSRHRLGYGYLGSAYMASTTTGIFLKLMIRMPRRPHHDVIGPLNAAVAGHFGVPSVIATTILIEVDDHKFKELQAGNYEAVRDLAEYYRAKWNAIPAEDSD